MLRTFLEDLRSQKRDWDIKPFYGVPKYQFHLGLITDDGQTSNGQPYRREQYVNRLLFVQRYYVPVGEEAFLENFSYTGVSPVGIVSTVTVAFGNAPNTYVDNSIYGSSMSGLTTVDSVNGYGYVVDFAIYGYNHIKITNFTPPRSSWKPLFCYDTESPTEYYIFEHNASFKVYAFESEKATGGGFANGLCCTPIIGTHLNQAVYITGYRAVVNSRPNILSKPLVAVG